MSPKISIIVPVYKVEKYLNRCLESLVGQTLTDLEIILVDDGSPDNCPHLCDAAAAKDKRIKVIHKENNGLGQARNTGLDAASGKYIAFVDSDDYVALNMFESLVFSAEKSGAQLVMSGVSFVGGNMFGKSDDYEETVYFNNETVFEGEDDIKELMLGIFGALPGEKRDSRCGMSVWKNIYLRETIEKNRVRFLSEREILSEDLIFMLDFLPHVKKAVGVPGVFYRYCRNGDSLSKSYNPARFDKSMVLLGETEKRISKYIAHEEYKIYLDRFTQGLARVLCSQEIMHAAEEKTPWRDLRKRLKMICGSEKIVNSLKSYPWYKLPPKQAVFAFLVKHKLYFLQKLTVAARGM